MKIIFFNGMTTIAADGFNFGCIDGGGSGSQGDYEPFANNELHNDCEKIHELIYKLSVKIERLSK